jgi:hypothetical protein
MGRPASRPIGFPSTGIQADFSKIPVKKTSIETPV